MSTTARSPALVGTRFDIDRGRAMNYSRWQYLGLLFLIIAGVALTQLGGWPAIFKSKNANLITCQNRCADIKCDPKPDQSTWLEFCHHLLTSCRAGCERRPDSKTSTEHWNNRKREIEKCFSNCSAGCNVPSRNECMFMCASNCMAP